MSIDSAALNCMAYGYDVRVRINGSDLAIKGGKSESRRLFSPSNEMASQIPPEMRAQLLVLKEGANRIEIDFTKTGGANDNLEITIYTDAPDPVFTFKSASKAKGRVDRALDLGAVVTLGDTDLK